MTQEQQLSIVTVPAESTSVSNHSTGGTIRHINQLLISSFAVSVQTDRHEHTDRQDSLQYSASPRHWYAMQQQQHLEGTISELRKHALCNGLQ